MHVLIINGSPKVNGKLGNIIQEIAAGAQEKHTCMVLHLRQLHQLRDCTGCMQCQQLGQCVIRDDIEQIEQEVAKSEVLIFVTPTHWGNMSALMLRMFERLFGFFIQEQRRGLPKARAGKGKKVILVTACSTPWPFHWICNQSRACFSRIKEICKYSQMQIVDTFVLPRTLQMQDIPPKYLQKARQLGASL